MIALAWKCFSLFAFVVAATTILRSYVAGMMKQYFVEIHSVLYFARRSA